MVKHQGRNVAIYATAVVGFLSGLVAASAFNLAGLTLRDGVLVRALFWENGESDFIVAFGCVFLLAWVASIVTVVRLCATRPSPGRRRSFAMTGAVTSCLSLVGVGLALTVLLVVLPAEYSWTVL